MTKKDIDDIIKIICPNDADFKRPIISPKYLKQELEQMALEQESNSDLISRQAVLEQTYLWSKDEFLRITNPFDYLCKRINSLPSVNPQKPKIGHWIDAKVGKLFPSNDFKCSECGNILDFDGVNCGRGDANYCPNCGARMESEEV